MNDKQLKAWICRVSWGMRRELRQELFEQIKALGLYLLAYRLDAKHRRGYRYGEPIPVAFAFDLRTEDGREYQVLRDCGVLILVGRVKLY
jgi:hypothetical protein